MITLILFKKQRELINEPKISPTERDQRWDELYEKFFGIVPFHRNPEYSKARNKNKSRRFVHKLRHFFDMGRIIEQKDNKYTKQIEEIVDEVKEDIEFMKTSR
mgnify:FL=1